MTQVVVLDILRNAYLTIMKVSLPVLLVSLIVGLIISVLQATTQVQEQTLSFVPKIVAVMLALIIFGSFMINGLISFTTNLYKIISTIS